MAVKAKSKQGPKPDPAAGEPPSCETAESALCDALLSLSDRDEAKAFLADLCTPAEIRALSERWLVARLLAEGKLSYREIAVAARASTTTVSRVARFLKDMPYGGYRAVLDKRKKENPQ